MSKRRQTVSDAVRRAILASGLSRYRISQETGLDQAALSRFMAGKTSLTLTSLDALADMLGLDMVARGPVRVSPPAKPGRKPKKGTL
jgi:transcriptional regulator with XRE-family HTH domain